MKNLSYLCTRKQDGAIAQLVEQRTENPCVPGSIPGGTTSKTLQIRELQKCNSLFLLLKSLKCPFLSLHKHSCVNHYVNQDVNRKSNEYNC